MWVVVTSRETSPELQRMAGPRPWANGIVHDPLLQLLFMLPQGAVKRQIDPLDYSASARATMLQSTTGV